MITGIVADRRTVAESNVPPPVIALLVRTSTAICAGNIESVIRKAPAESLVPCPSST
jgi:hypothetical protein